jgi:hypothetical protein
MSTIDASVPAEIIELSPYAPTRSTITATPLSAEELRKTELPPDSVLWASASDVWPRRSGERWKYFAKSSMAWI